MRRKDRGLADYCRAFFLCVPIGVWRCVVFSFLTCLRYRRRYVMPMKPKKPCKHPGCPRLTDGKYCEEHAKLHAGDRRSAAARGYDSAWRRERKKFLAEHPLCLKCFDEKKIVRATVVDHIKPHRGDMNLFWDRSNWQPLCKHHHDVKTMTEDRNILYPF